MRRILAPAFLTTVSLASGCTKKPIEDTNTHNPPYIEPDAASTRRTQNPPAIEPDAGPTPETTASTTADKPTPDKPTKKRKRTAAATWSNDGAGPKDWASLKTVNPKDANGRAILAMSDDRCAVQVPFKGPMPTNMPTGFSPRSYEYLDCPAAMDDAAYDECTFMISVDTKSDPLTCYCMSDGGNPPPPPRKLKCPANAKDIAKKP